MYASHILTFKFLFYLSTCVPKLIDKIKMNNPLIIFKYMILCYFSLLFCIIDT